LRCFQLKQFNACLASAGGDPLQTGDEGCVVSSGLCRGEVLQCGLCASGKLGVCVGDLTNAINGASRRCSTGNRRQASECRSLALDFADQVGLRSAGPKINRDALLNGAALCFKRGEVAHVIDELLTDTAALKRGRFFLDRLDGGLGLLCNAPISSDQPLCISVALAEHEAALTQRGELFFQRGKEDISTAGRRCLRLTRTLRCVASAEQRLRDAAKGRVEALRVGRGSENSPVEGLTVEDVP
jgi:hypothetical protein